MTLAMDGTAATPPRTGPLHPLTECDACPYCRDACDHDEFCVTCQKQRHAKPARGGGSDRGWFLEALAIVCQCQETQQPHTYTRCQIRRHNHAESAWVLVGNVIYDVTPYLRSHPAGAGAILKKCGGVADCTEDLRFHSKRSQKAWKKNKVGTLCRCPRERQLGLF